MPPLNILHVLRAPVGGLFRHVLDLTHELIARGHRVGIVADSRTGGAQADEILRIGREEQCDLIAMTTHGHRLLSDLVHGTTITRVRHEAEIPIFLVKASPD